jgi:hypothetical protein
MTRFDIGDWVKLVGPISEHYDEASAIIVRVHVHPALPHLNQYRVLMSGGADDIFYEFQLARSSAGPAAIPNRGSA